METTAPSPLSLHPKLTAGTRIGHYRVEELISSGGFGAVYKVSRDGQLFALKLPLAGLQSAPDDERRTTEGRIQREVVSLMTLKHPGIVGVHGFDRWPDPVTGALYLVMDYVDGTPLHAWIRSVSPSVAEVVEVFRLLAMAIHQMHAMGVVHRDIKGSNVLVTPDSEAKWRPVLVDFGMARPAFTPDVTREHILVGTEGCWAPELFQTPGPYFQYTPATDLYALGALFYEALTGAAPVSRADSNSLLAIPPPTKVARPGALPDELDGPAMRLLAKRPEDRTPSARAFADELAVLLTQQSARETVVRLTLEARGRGPDAPNFSVGDDTVSVVVDAGGEGVHRIPVPELKESEGAVARVGAASGRPAGGAEQSGKEPPGRVTEPVERPTLPLFVVEPRDFTPGANRNPTAREVPYPRLLWLSLAAERAASLAVQSVFWLLVGLVVFVALTSLVGFLAHRFGGPEVDAAVRAAYPSPVRAEPAVPPTAPATGVPAPPPARAVPHGAAPTGRTNDALAPKAASVVARAALVGRAQAGPVQAVLRQPVVLATAVLPTGATLDGTADELPDGRFLLRFDAVRRTDGSTLPLNATALVDASAAERHPLKPGGPPPGFEFDLALSSK